MLDDRTALLLSTHEVVRLSGATYRQLPADRDPALPARTQAKIVLADSGCWLWTGATGAGGRGYGLLTYKQVVWRAHCFVYEWLVGPVPDGLELDHLCEVTVCVCPFHLEPVTHQENTRRHYARQETCKNGHPWTEENTYRSPSHGRRDCRACQREKQRRYYAARKAAAR